MSKTRRNVSSPKNGHSFNRIEDLLKNQSTSLANSGIRAEKSIKELDLTLTCPVSGRTPNQKKYIRAIQDNDVVMCIGKAGVGKTRISVGMAAKFLSENKVGRIIFVRPTVPCDEEIGFIPGEIDAKIGPYLVPVYEELAEFFSAETIKALTSGTRPTVVGIPLGMIKGRNLKNAFIIVDESQDATKRQLKRLITRLGENSTIVFNGDITQSDKFPQGKTDFEGFIEDLEGGEGISVVRLTDEDNQRHPRMVGWIERLEKNF